jgi:hypothetical protein
MTTREERVEGFEPHRYYSTASSKRLIDNNNIDVNNRSHLLVACQQKDNSEVIKLLVHAKANVSDEDILMAVISNYKEDIIDLILDQKVDHKGHVDFSKHFLPKNIPKAYGYNPLPTSGTNVLSTAICLNKVDAVRSLLRHRAQMQDNYGRSALEVVVSRSYKTDKEILTIIPVMPKTYETSIVYQGCSQILCTIHFIYEIKFYSIFFEKKTFSVRLQ